MKAIRKGFQEVQATDHEFAAYLRKQDPEWTHKKINDERTNFLAKGKLVGIGIYKNSPPVARRFFLPYKMVNE